MTLGVVVTLVAWVASETMTHRPQANTAGISLPDQDGVRYYYPVVPRFPRRTSRETNEQGIALEVGLANGAAWLHKWHFSRSLASSTSWHWGLGGFRLSTMSSPLFGFSQITVLFPLLFPLLLFSSYPQRQSHDDGLLTSVVHFAVGRHLSYRRVDPWPTVALAS